MEALEVFSEADSRSGAAVARFDDQREVEPYSSGVEGRIWGVSETDRVPICFEETGVSLASEPWCDDSCEYVVVQCRDCAGVSQLRAGARNGGHGCAT